MRPIRCAAFNRPIGSAFVVFFVFGLVLVCGCRFPRTPARPAVFALPERDARQAGALALYAKGILLESSTQGDTNVNRQAACEAFRQAVALDPDNRRPLEALISALADNARFEEALSALEPFLTRHPEEVELRFEAARLAEASERTDDAARHCAALFALRPDERELGHALIRLLFQSDRDAEALRVMRDLQTRFNDAKSAAVPVQWAIHFTREGPQTAARALSCLDLALPLRTNAAERAALLTLAAENRLLLGQTNTAETVLLDAYRRLGALRRRSRALRHGGSRWVHACDDVLVFLRESRDERVLVQVSRAEHRPVALDVATLDGGLGETLFGSGEVRRTADTVILPATGAGVHVWELETRSKEGRDRG